MSYLNDTNIEDVELPPLLQEEHQSQRVADENPIKEEKCSGVYDMLPEGHDITYPTEPRAIASNAIVQEEEPLQNTRSKIQRLLAAPNIADVKVQPHQAARRKFSMQFMV